MSSAPTQPCAIETPYYLRIDGHEWLRTEQLMLGGSIPECQFSDTIDGTRVDYSYVGQLGLLGLGEEKAIPAPDIVLFTARSAIPVADAVRGSFEVCGKPVPKLGVINCGGQAQIEHRADVLTEIREIKRLKSLVAGAEKVLVVEQFVHFGHGINHAKRLLLEAGVQEGTHIRFMEGRWYHDIGDLPFNSNKVTSDAKKGMKQIGRKAVTLLA
jgi:hypothetical protein